MFMTSRCVRFSIDSRRLAEVMSNVISRKTRPNLSGSCERTVRGAGRQFTSRIRPPSYWPTCFRYTGCPFDGPSGLAFCVIISTYADVGLSETTSDSPHRIGLPQIACLWQWQHAGDHVEMHRSHHHPPTHRTSCSRL